MLQLSNTRCFGGFVLQCYTVKLLWWQANKPNKKEGFSRLKIQAFKVEDLSFHAHFQLEEPVEGRDEFSCFS